MNAPPPPPPPPAAKKTPHTMGNDELRNSGKNRAITKLGRDQLRVEICDTFTRADAYRLIGELELVARTL
jgi:hypothetical protein